jgi:ABC-type branched-subunit amino acid transport system substrate-binding protein
MTTQRQTGQIQRRQAIIAAGAATALGAAGPLLAQNSPIRIGSSLAITGPLSATAQVHKLTGEIYLEDLNRRGGLLGRKVEWVLKDDQSKPDVARTLYEQLVTVDKVDLLLGPYATPNILSAMGVAQRYNKLIVHHSFGMPHLAKYDRHFPTWATGVDPARTTSDLLLDFMATMPNSPKRIAIVTSKFAPCQLVANGMREGVKRRGLTELMFLEWDFGNRDFGAIASRLKDAKPDFIYAGVIAMEGMMLLDAMKKIDYKAPPMFHHLPSPGPMVNSPDAQGMLVATLFEEHEPMLSHPGAKEFVATYNQRAKAAGLPDNAVDTQAAGSFAAWQVLEAGVKATNSLDDGAISHWLKRNRVPTVLGPLRFDGPNNYGDDLTKIKQVQNKDWVVIWPKASAKPGAQYQPT